MKIHCRFLPLLLLLPLNLLAQQDVALYDDTIVQEIRLMIDPVAWQTLRDNYQLDDYYKADFAWKTTTVTNIGIKSRGSGSRSPFKPNLTLKFSKYAKQKFLTHNSILLKANNQDGSMMREYLSMELMRRLGLPAPREAPARLYINGEFFGLYTIVEDIDDDFFTRVYGESSGYQYAYNPVLDYEFNYLGEDPAAYGLMFEPKNHTDDPQFAKLYEALKAVNDASAADFPTVGPTYVDLAGFMKLLAAESYMADSDGILSDVWGMNNFFLYRPVASSQFRFSPWDTDFAMSWAGRPVMQNLDRNILASKALAVPQLRRVFLDTILQAATIAGDRDDWLFQEVNRLYALIGPDARLDPHKQCLRADIMVPCNADDFETQVAGLREFALDRYTAATSQLAALVDTPDPKMSAGGAVNAATYQAGLVPGSLAVLFGSSLSQTGEFATSWPLPLKLGDASVTVNGVAAPLLFVSPLQLNFQIPWNLPEGQAAVKVTVDGITTDPLTAQLVHVAPGIFTASHAADFSPVNAAKTVSPGEILSLWATGLGPVSTHPRDGEAASLLTLSSTVETVTATLNGAPADVLFAGLAPGYAGLYQVNVRMPASLTSSDGSLILQVAGKNSPAFRVPLK